MKDALSDLFTREESGRKTDRAICVSYKQRGESRQRVKKKKNEWIRDGYGLTSLSPFFFLVWTESDSTSLSNWSTSMFNVSIVFWRKERERKVQFIPQYIPLIPRLKSEDAVN